MTQITKTISRPPASSSWLNTIIRYLLVTCWRYSFFGLILLISGKDPIQSYKDIFSSTFGSTYGFSEVIVAMIPMLITALAVALPSRIGLINVGGEGQLYIGAAFATWGALTFQDQPAWLLLPLMGILGMFGGALWAFIPGYLKAIGLVNETITTLLFNSIAPKIVGFLIFGFWHSPMDTVKTANFVPAARLPTFFGTRVHLGLVIALVLLALFWFVMKYTRWGLEMRAIGGNPQAARRNGLPAKRYLIIVMCIGGAIAGLAGMSQVSGFYGVLLLNFSMGLGFMGFLICWLAGGDPVGILLMSFVVAVIITGGNHAAADPRSAFCGHQYPAGHDAVCGSCSAQFFRKEKSMSLLAILGVFSSAIFSGTSLLYATLGEVVDERSGIVNLGLEGVLLVSASTGFAVTFMTGNPYLGVLAAMLAGGLMNMILGYLVIHRKANQLASGLALMFFGFGLSALIGKHFVGAKITGLPRLTFPGFPDFPSCIPRCLNLIF